MILNKRIIKLLFALAFLFTLYLAFYQLEKSPLQNWDEAWYADVTRHMMRTGEYFVLYWNKELWLDKPPMYMWLSALVSSVIGLSEFSVRVPSAISGVVAIMLVSWFAYKHYGLAPSILAFITLACNNLYVWRMRSGNIDTLASLLMLLVFLVMVSKHKHKYVWLGILFAVMYLTRASLVYFPLIVFVLHELLFVRKQLGKQSKEYIKLFLITVIVPGIWLVIGSMKVGIEFAQYFLFASDRSAASIGLSHIKKDYILYTYYALRRFAFVFAVGILFAIRYIKDNKVFLMLVFGVGLIVELSFIERSNNWYLVPSMPFWSLLVAFGTYHILKLLRNNRFAVIGILGVSLFFAYRTFTVSIIPVLDASAYETLAQSSKKINALTKTDDIIVRLDHLYPTTVYYTDRKILSSPIEADKNEGSWRTRKTVIKNIKQKKIHWIVGTTNDISAFQATAPDIKFKSIQVNKEETILQAQ